MDEIEKLFRDLAVIAAAMCAMEKEDDAKVFYDVMSGSLIWTDELPKKAPASLDCLRFVLRYRTGLIVGDPEPSFELFWREATELFPNWIGFSSERCTSNEELAGFYRRERLRVRTQFRAD